MCKSILSDSPSLSQSQAPITFDQVRTNCAAAGLPIARLTSERTAKIPSATAPGVEYTVWIQDGGTWAVCSCPDGGMSCWHAQRGLELYTEATEGAAAPTLPVWALRPVALSEAA